MKEKKIFLSVMKTYLVLVKEQYEKCAGCIIKSGTA